MSVTNEASSALRHVKSFREDCDPRPDYSSPPVLGNRESRDAAVCEDDDVAIGPLQSARELLEDRIRQRLFRRRDRTSGLSIKTPVRSNPDARPRRSQLTTGPCGWSLASARHGDCVRISPTQIAVSTLKTSSTPQGMSLEPSTFAVQTSIPQHTIKCREHRTGLTLTLPASTLTLASLYVADSCPAAGRTIFQDVELLFHLVIVASEPCQRGQSDMRVTPAS